MKSKQQNTTPFKFVTEPFIRENHHQLSRSQFERLRWILPKHLYWCQPCGRGGAILWNLPLFLSYMSLGADSQQHKILIDEYIATLPTAA
jgi:hypothetical protein